MNVPTFERELKQILDKMDDVVLSFSVGSFGKKYFSKISDIDVVLVLENEDFKTSRLLSQIKRRLEKKYKIKIDFMMNNIFELNSQYVLDVMNKYVLDNFQQGRYTIFKNNVGKVVNRKDARVTIVFNCRYYFDKLRNIVQGKVFHVKGQTKKIIGKERTKVCISALFNIVKQFIRYKYNRSYEEYDDMINFLRKKDHELSKFLDVMKKIKYKGRTINEKELSMIYASAKNLYSKVLCGCELN